ncbi:MAG: hypothetical protein LBD09_02810, partial [Treponema sp.]|nr:hypothetical protein [Treponema sp.]
MEHMKLWNNCWKRTGKRSLSGAEAFLRSREPYCVGAASRFFTGAPSSIWMTGIEKGGPWEPRSPGEPGGMDGGEGLLLYCRNLLFPVFRFSPRRAEAFRAAGGIPLPPFFSLTLAASPLHAVQGLTEDAALLEAALAKRRLLPSAVFDYELRSLENREPVADYPNIKGPPGLVVRKPEPEDVDRLFPLQAAYEQEEVLPPGAAFDPAVCRRALELLVAGNKILAAEL